MPGTLPGLLRKGMSLLIGRYGVRSLALLLGILATGCRSEAGGGRSGAALGAGASGGILAVVLDSVLLRESDSLYIAQFGRLAIDPLDGGFYVEDGYVHRVHRFDRRGELRNVYGRPGDGPGELRGVGSIFVVSDSVVAVDDSRERTLELFHRRTGEFQGRRRHGGASGGQILRSRGGDTIWMPFPDFPAGAFSASMWVPGEDLLRHLWAVPEAYRRHPHYYATGVIPTLVRWRDVFLLGFGSLPNLYIVDLDGERGGYRDSLRIPVRRRRVIPEDIVEIAETRPEAEKYSYLSKLQHLWRRPDGSYLAVHRDPHLEGSWPLMEAWSDHYVSVLSPDLAWACVDEPLDLGPRASAALDFRGDTLFVLQERVVEGEVGTEPTVERWVKLVAIDVAEDRCEWLSTAIPGASD